MSTPTLKAVSPSVPEEDLHLKPQPVEIYGLPEGGVSEVSWGDVSGKPTTFPPETHTHTIAQVTGLQAIIDDLTTRIEALESAAG